jgi:hypothetical protein
MGLHPVRRRRPTIPIAPSGSPFLTGFHDGDIGFDLTPANAEKKAFTISYGDESRRDHTPMKAAGLTRR